MYLIEADPFPITPAEVRADIGLMSHALDLLIEAGIASLCLLAGGTRRETWAIRCGDDFAERAARYGTPLVGAVRQFPGDRQLYRECTYAADPARIAELRRRAAHWAMGKPDIIELIERERIERLEGESVNADAAALESAA